MTKFNGLWLGKLGNANSWYHIYPFAAADITNQLHIIRYKSPNYDVPNSIIHTYREWNKLIDCINMFYKGAKVFKKNQIDYVVTFNPVPYGTIAWLLARLFRKPIIIGLIGNDFSIDLQKKWYKIVLIKILKKTDFITITGNAMRPYLEKIGIDPKKIGIYPHCVNDQWFKNEPEKKSKYDLITVSNLIPRKQIQDIIEAVHILKTRGIFLKLAIIGEGAERNKIEKAIDHYRLGEAVDMLGHRDNVIEYLKKSKIYVQSSNQEGLSISLIEAMALGLVPVATKAGSEEDIIQSGRNGYVVNIGKPDEIADAIEKLCDPNTYKSFQQELLSKRQTFNISRAIEVSEKIITAIVKNR